MLVVDIGQGASKRRYKRTVELDVGEEARIDLPSEDATGVVEGTVHARSFPADSSSISLSPISPNSSLAARAQADDQGKFTFSAVPPGDYRLTARAWDSKGERINTHELAVESGHTTRHDIVLAAGSGSLEVSLLLENEPVDAERAWIMLYRDTDFLSIRMDREEGVFFAENLTPGAYRVEATSRDFPRQRRIVEVAAGTTTTVEILVERGTATLQGYMDTGEIWYTNLWIREPGRPPVVHRVRPSGRFGP